MERSRAEPNGMEPNEMEPNGMSDPNGADVLSLLTTKSLYIIPRHYSASLPWILLRV